MIGSTGTVIYASLALVALGPASAGGVPAQPPTGQERWVAAAESFVRRLEAGAFDSAAAMIAPAVPAGALSAERLGELWAQLTAAAGTLEELRLQKLTPRDTLRIVDLHARFTRQAFTIRVVLTPEALVTGLWFLPPESPYTPPDYGDAAAFEEVEVQIGEGRWRVGGTLTLPEGEERVPAVVLVHGSGPHDRDATIGPNRPFRDLAGGLAARGVAVLRYDKRTRVHGAAMDAASITVEEEVIEDALAALDVVRAHPRIDPDRVFIAGHSLGAMLAPEIAQRDGRVAGAILLAAPARPMWEVLASQLDYVAGLPENADADARARLAALRDSAALLEARKLEPGTMVLGAPASYYYDLETRRPTDVAARLDVPLLVLQGGRDYQSTMEDFRLWQSILAGRPNATLKAYPALNHLFMPGTGMATPAEYTSTAGHVDVEVIDDIAAWIRTGRAAHGPS